MASLRITRFAGILPEASARLKPAVNAQVAHNCLLTDGSLRPQAQWTQLQHYDAGFEARIRGVAFDRHNDLATMYASFDPVTLEGEPFAANTTVGASPNSIVNWYRTGEGQNPNTVAVYGGGVSGTVSYERSYDSVKPVNRIYALTRVRRIGNRAEEGSLIPIPGQSPTDVLYEGDLVRVEFNASFLDDNATHIRLYRTISGLDTGDNVTNPLDTEWHLVDEVPLLAGNVTTYIDGNAATALPLDVFYGHNFHPPEIVARYFGLSEGGWFVTASLGGDIQISERYMHHAWPVDNWLRLAGEEITDIAVHMDNVYVGTLQRPYVVALSAGEHGLQAAATPFPEQAPCLPNTMTPAPGGALYASGQGIVALSRDGLRVVSREVVNAGDTLYSKRLSDGRISTAKISNTSFGAYYQGKYIAFCEAPPIDDGVFLTTTLYPLEVTEEYITAGDMLEGHSMSLTVEDYRSAGDFDGGTLRALLQRYDMPPNEDGSEEPDPQMHLQSQGDFDGGTLTTLLKDTEIEDDGVQVGGTLIGGTLQTLLVSTEYEDDGVRVGGTIIAGTLE